MATHIRASGRTTNDMAKEKMYVLTPKSHTRTHAHTHVTQHPNFPIRLQIASSPSPTVIPHFLAFPNQSLRRLLQHTPAPPALCIMAFHHMLIPMPLDDLVRRGLACYRRQRTAPRTTVTGRTISATATESSRSLVPTARG